MWRERVRRAAAALAARVAVGLRSPRALRLRSIVRERPDTVLAALLLLGVLAMVLHWS